ncbi:YybH family protein [Nocardioides marmoriginsengisoli]|uniref:YybH family protein n=1 Tax=Nocardioides marmoriginsengisoli TaxID=661483 RepID=UPI00160D9FDE|nr:nuclear transport factor 2 family protein [Nocardioides marmoriginsengisoli]
MNLINDQDVGAWLEEFAARVRARDLDGGRSLFDPSAIGFGTVADRYDGLDELVGAQWSDVWPRTEEFAFDAADARWLDEVLCVVAATWTSVGTTAGERRTRTGRATVVLRRSDDGGLLAVHTHMSMTPGTPA